MRMPVSACIEGGCCYSPSNVMQGGSEWLLFSEFCNQVFGVVQRQRLDMQMEAPVLVDEIIHTCSNEKIAHAAVASIGFVFALRVKSSADLHGLSVGAFAAKVVHEFGSVADECERKVVRRAMELSQQPILGGLQTILERKLNAEAALGHAGRPLSGWASRAPEYEVRRSSCCL
jgi:hypothetical protein